MKTAWSRGHYHHSNYLAWFSRRERESEGDGKEGKKERNVQYCGNEPDRRISAISMNRVALGSPSRFTLHEIQQTGKFSSCEIWKREVGCCRTQCGYNLRRIRVISDQGGNSGLFGELTSRLKFYEISFLFFFFFSQTRNRRRGGTNGVVEIFFQPPSPLPPLPYPPMDTRRCNCRGRVKSRAIRLNDRNIPDFSSRCQLIARRTRCL